MAVIVSPGSFIKVIDLPDERRMQCKAEAGKLRYWLIGDWRRGRQHPTAPTVDNWKWEVNRLASFLNFSLPVTIGKPENVE